jgi:hypothetical protein
MSRSHNFKAHPTWSNKFRIFPLVFTASGVHTPVKNGSYWAGDPGARCFPALVESDANPVKCQVHTLMRGAFSLVYHVTDAGMM